MIRDASLDKLSHNVGLPSFKFVDLFAGIGGFHLAARENGESCVFASEIDPHAVKAYRENYNVDTHGDIFGISSETIPDHDLLCAGFPCQPFSVMGQRRGFDDIRGSLFFEIARILKGKKPKYAILENVKQLSTHNKGETFRVILSELKALGYHVFWKVLNALRYGLPQKRERVVIVCSREPINFVFPEPSDKYVPLSQILQERVNAKYHVSERIKEKRRDKHTSRHKLSVWHENKSGSVTSYPYSCALRARASHNYLLVNGERRLTPREMLRLQGFPESFNIVCGDAQTRRQAGNAVPVPMIAKVIHNIFHATNDERGKIKAISALEPHAPKPTNYRNYERAKRRNRVNTQRRKGCAF